MASFRLTALNAYQCQQRLAFLFWFRFRYFWFCGLCFGVLYFAVAGGEPSADFGRVIFERAIAAAISDLAIFINDVEAFRPRGIGVVGGVIHVIDAEGNGILVTFRKIVGDGQAVREIPRLRVANIVFDVGFHLPLVGGMGFANVYGQKISVIFVIIENAHDVADLATERRSGEAAENQDQRLSAGTFANMKRVGAI